MLMPSLRSPCHRSVGNDHRPAPASRAPAPGAARLRIAVAGVAARGGSGFARRRSGGRRRGGDRRSGRGWRIAGASRQQQHLTDVDGVGRRQIVDPDQGAHVHATGLGDAIDRLAPFHRVGRPVRQTQHLADLQGIGRLQTVGGSQAHRHTVDGGDAVAVSRAGTRTGRDRRASPNGTGTADYAIEDRYRRGPDHAEIRARHPATAAR